MRLGFLLYVSRWKSCTNIVEDTVTGYVYEFGNDDALKNIIAHNPDKILNLKKNCLKRAHDFLPEKALFLSLTKSCDNTISISIV